MYSLPKNVYRERIDFSKIKTTVPIPNLIEIQKKSYERFLQMNRLPSEREDAGLQSVFKSVFPISDFRENSSLEFIEYSIGNWECKCGKLQGLHHLRKPCSNCGATLIADPYGDREVLCPRCGKANQARGDVCDICGNTVGLKLKYDVDECQERGMTYAVPLKVTIRLVVWNKDPETGVKTIRDIKEQEVYFGDIPLMTENGTFIINGTERVIVTSCTARRAPSSIRKTRRSTSRRSSRIAARGSSSSTTPRTCSTCASTGSGSSSRRCSCARSACAAPTRSSARSTTSTSCILKQGAIYWAVADTLVGLRAAKDIVVPGENFTVQQGKKITKNAVEALKRPSVEAVEISDAELEGAFAAADVVDPSTGEVILEANEPLEPRVISMAQEKNVDRIDIFFPEKDEVGPIIGADAQEGSDPHARRGADRDLPPPAAGRSADARQLAVALREHVLQPAEVRLLARRPAEAEHEAAAEHAARREDPAPAGLLRGASSICSSCGGTRRTWTTSITSATGASARSASCSRTSSASGWSGWSAPSRRRCRSTRKWRPPCRTT